MRRGFLALPALAKCAPPGRELASDGEELRVRRVAPALRSPLLLRAGTGSRAQPRSLVAVQRQVADERARPLEPVVVVGDAVRLDGPELVRLRDQVVEILQGGQPEHLAGARVGDALLLLRELGLLVRAKGGRLGERSLRLGRRLALGLDVGRGDRAEEGRPQGRGERLVALHPLLELDDGPDAVRLHHAVLEERA